MSPRLKFIKSSANSKSIDLEWFATRVSPCMSKLSKRRNIFSKHLSRSTIHQTRRQQSLTSNRSLLVIWSWSHNYNRRNLILASLHKWSSIQSNRKETHWAYRPYQAVSITTVSCQIAAINLWVREDLCSKILRIAKNSTIISSRQRNRYFNNNLPRVVALVFWTWISKRIIWKIYVVSRHPPRKARVPWAVPRACNHKQRQELYLRIRSCLQFQSSQRHQKQSKRNKTSYLCPS